MAENVCISKDLEDRETGPFLLEVGGCMHMSGTEGKRERGAMPEEGAGIIAVFLSLSIW